MTDQEIAAKQYAHPEALVSTQWLAEHLGDPAVRILESDEDVLLYEIGHIPGALKIDWHADLNDQVQRDYISRDEFEALVRRLGIDDSMTVVLYGDKSNWWATYALWVFQLFGFRNASILDGGRAKSCCTATRATGGRRTRCGSSSSSDSGTQAFSTADARSGKPRAAR